MTKSATNRISAACSIPNTPLRHKRCTDTNCTCRCHKEGYGWMRRRADSGGSI